MRSRANPNQATSSTTTQFFSRSSRTASTPFFSTENFAQTPAVQTKPTVGPADDRFEREADAVADRVVQRMEAGDVEEADAPFVQRKCAACAAEDTIHRQTEEDEPERASEEEATLQRKGEQSSSADAGAAQAAGAVSSGGRSLSSSERARFEPHFGRDFSRVRIHEGPAVSAAAKAIRAQAYTLGSDIALGSGEYSPGTRSGNRLMAHELTHVLQQNRGSTIRRVPPTPTPLPGAVPAAGPADFEIDRVGRSSERRISFASGSSALTADADAAIAAIKARAPTSVRLIGFVSMDEANALAQARASAVRTALTTGPNAVTVSSATGNPTAMASRSDFSGARSVEVIPAGATQQTLDCSALDAAGDPIHPPTQPCPAMDPDTWTDFNAAWVIAKNAMQRAVAAIAATAANPTGTPSADSATLIDRFFGNHDPATLTTLRNNLTRLKAHVDGLDTITSCGGQCDIGGCSEGPIAYNNGVDAASTMTLCVPVFKRMHVNDQARNLIHESAHGTSPLGGPANPTRGTRDVAYRHERIIFQLPPADRLRNSDSYALFALFLREAQSTGNAAAVPAGISTPATDLISGFGAGEQPVLEHAIATLEKRLSWAKSWVGQLFGQVNDVRSGALTWATSWAEDLMTQAAARFPLTAPPAVPTVTDQRRIAGMLDRYVRMKSAVKRDLTISRMAAGVISWPVAGTFIPGRSLEVGPEFFTATPENQISLLLEHLALATRDVEPAFIPAYVSLAKWIHDQNP